MFEQLKADIQRALESKRENDPQRLLSVIKNNPTKILSAENWNEILNKKFPKIIKDELKNRPVASTRRNLAGLESNNEIVRVGEKATRGVKYTFDRKEPNVWYKKLLKTGKTTSPPSGKTSLKIEIYTFEKNDECRFESLFEAVKKQVPELEYIDTAGYESSRDSEGEISSYQFEAAYLIVQSGVGTTYFDGTVTLKDTNEPPC